MFIYFISALFFAWLIVISYVVYRIRKHYFNLVEHTKKHKMDDVLDKLIENGKLYQSDIEIIKKQLNKIIDDSKFYYQKLGLVRFNPFGRTGGEQSFVLALLNHNQSGIIMNFIYTHEGIRVYTKRIKDGKGEEYSLSEEEKDAVAKAK